MARSRGNGACAATLGSASTRRASISLNSLQVLETPQWNEAPSSSLLSTHTSKICTSRQRSSTNNPTSAPPASASYLVAE